MLKDWNYQGLINGVNEQIDKVFGDGCSADPDYKIKVKCYHADGGHISFEFCGDRLMAFYDEHGKVKVVDYTFWTVSFNRYLGA